MSHALAAVAGVFGAVAAASAVLGGYFLGAGNRDAAGGMLVLTIFGVGLTIVAVVLSREEAA